MKVPYGIASFKSIRQEDYLYVDKTRFIEKLEHFSTKYLFFIRPRRFGKSLFLSTLEHYYDINAIDDFETLFGGLYVSQNPTPLKNSYLVLQLDFSGLNTNNRDSLQKSINTRLTITVSSFIKKYAQYIPDASTLLDAVSTYNDAGSIIDALVNALKETDKKIYLIIDEYDHFANDIIAMGDSEFYKDIVRASGFVRDFYETVKLGTKSVIDRIFITGASPVMLDDLTSGFNIATNLTMDETLNEMLGFTQSELENIIQKLNIKPEDISISLKEYYNGYLFNIDCQERVYNPDMVLYYFDYYIRTGKQPKQLIDTNVKTDYGRLYRLTKHEVNRKMLEKIIKEERIVANIASEFSFDMMYDDEYFVSLLFYMGLLTIEREERSRLVLGVPNYVIKIIYWEYIARSLKEKYNIGINLEQLSLAIEDMAFEGKIKPFLDYISANVLKQLSNRDLIEFDEKYIKVILFTYLTMTRIYKVISEKEVENGYVDIYLEWDRRIPDVRYEWIIELKYLKKADKNALEEAKQEGLMQLKRYASSRGVENREDVKQAVIVFVGKDEYSIV